MGVNIYIRILYYRLLDWLLFAKKYSIPILESVLFCPIVYYTTWLTILLGEISHNDTIQIAATGTILFLIFNVITRLWKTVKLGKQRKEWLDFNVICWYGWRLQSIKTAHNSTRFTVLGQPYALNCLAKQQTFSYPIFTKRLIKLREGFPHQAGKSKHQVEIPHSKGQRHKAV